MIYWTVFLLIEYHLPQTNMSKKRCFYMIQYFLRQTDTVVLVLILAKFLRCFDLKKIEASFILIKFLEGIEPIQTFK
jgi:hypothetical protein